MHSGAVPELGTVKAGGRHRRCVWKGYPGDVSPTRLRKMKRKRNKQGQRNEGTDEPPSCHDTTLTIACRAAAAVAAAAGVAGTTASAAFAVNDVAAAAAAAAAAAVVAVAAAAEPACD